jgi:hypothetical protein
MVNTLSCLSGTKAEARACDRGKRGNFIKLLKQGIPADSISPGIDRSWHTSYWQTGLYIVTSQYKTGQ